MKQGSFRITENTKVAQDTWYLRLAGDHGFTQPGQFVQIALDGFYLRRPFAACDWEDGGFGIAYMVVGEGTKNMTALAVGTTVDCLTGLGNGFDTARAAQPLLLAGSVGAAPMLALAKRLRDEQKPVRVILGFADAAHVFFAERFAELGCDTVVFTENDSVYRKGLVTDAIAEKPYDYYYCCGSMNMMRAVSKIAAGGGQVSLESRMACGFGACMGCTCKTTNGPKRTCKEGPVFDSAEVVW